MAQSRSFKTRDAERRFYQMLERYEAAHAPAVSAGPLEGVGRLLQRRWLKLRLITAARLRTR